MTYQDIQHQFKKGSLYTFTTIEHGSSIGVTNSSDSKSPFFGAKFDPNSDKGIKKLLKENHIDLPKKIHQAY